MFTAIRNYYQFLQSSRLYGPLTETAKNEHHRDELGLPQTDHGIDRSVKEAMAWLCRAQDSSTSHDGGVARDYSLIHGWGASYPETTGYIIPTFINYAHINQDEDYSRRARQMTDWLVSIQLSDGAFQGGKIDSQPVAPVTFNTGQILIGLANATKEFSDPRYREATQKAANWLVETQDADGCWRSHPSPFARAGDKSYDTHVAWGLLEAARVIGEQRYVDSALANVRWAISVQSSNGWFDHCCLVYPEMPLTHTIGYALRGVLEAYLYSKEDEFLEASFKTANSLVTVIGKDGYLPGRLDADWKEAIPWVCLTGAVQVASCLLILYQITDDQKYRDAAFSLNRYVRCSMRIDGALDTRGGIKGSFPVWGRYGAYEYLNWAAKFFVDSNLLEKEIRLQKGLPLSCN